MPDFSFVFKANPYHDEAGRFATSDGQLSKSDILKSPKSTYQKLAEHMDANTEGHIDVQAVKAKLKEGDSLYLEMKSWPLSKISRSTIDAGVDHKRANSSKGSVIIGANGEIVDGRHRVAAALAAGTTHISAWVPAKDALATAKKSAEVPTYSATRFDR